MMRRLVSTTIFGKRFASAFAQIWCVATDCPSTRPVSARINAPEHRETNVAPAACRLRTQDTTPVGTSGSGRFTMVGGMISVRGFGLPRGALSYTHERFAAPQ